MPKTEAESVDDIVAASSSDGTRAKCILVHGIPDSQKMNSPVSRAVRSTPAVESTSPGNAIGRIDDSDVDMPPEKRIIHSAIMPTNWAWCISLNWMPRPSEPNPIPTSRNTSSRGKPVR